MQRRKFVQSAVFAAAGLSSIRASAKPETASPIAADSLYVIGPMDGYSPQIGTIVSMLNTTAAPSLALPKT